jgi:hypothetical protein
LLPRLPASRADYVFSAGKDRAFGFPAQSFKLEISKPRIPEIGMRRKPGSSPVTQERERHHPSQALVKVEPPDRRTSYMAMPLVGVAAPAF